MITTEKIKESNVVVYLSFINYILTDVVNRYDTFITILQIILIILGILTKLYQKKETRKHNFFIKKQVICFFIINLILQYFKILILKYMERFFALFLKEIAKNLFVHLFAFRTILFTIISLLLIIFYKNYIFMYIFGYLIILFIIFQNFYLSSLRLFKTKITFPALTMAGLTTLYLYKSSYTWSFISAFIFLTILIYSIIYYFFISESVEIKWKILDILIFTLKANKNYVIYALIAGAIIITLIYSKYKKTL